MIKTIIGINLKVPNEKFRILILFFLGILITNLHYELIEFDNTTLLMADVIIETYGGLVPEYSIFNIFYFILWITPYIIILNSVNISTIDRFRESITLVLPRVKNKKKWLMAFNLAIILRIILYSLVLFLSSIIVIWIKSGCSAFQNLSIHTAGISNINQYFILFYIILLNILALISIQFFLNNLYSIFSKSSEASALGIILYISPIFYSKNTALSKFFLVNRVMLKRYEIFDNGFKGVNFLSSSVFIITFIMINFFIGLYIIKKQDILDI